MCVNKKHIKILYWWGLNNCTATGRLLLYDVGFALGGMSAGTAYFTNKRGDCCAVVVSTSGRIRMRTWTGKNWR